MSVLSATATKEYCMEFGNALPSPVLDKPEYRERRLITAVETFVALRPGDAYEARLAVRIVLCGAHAVESLRLANVNRADFAKTTRCRAQAASMMRAESSAKRALEREQKVRLATEAVAGAVGAANGARAEPEGASAPPPQAEPQAPPQVQAAAASSVRTAATPSVQAVAGSSVQAVAGSSVQAAAASSVQAVATSSVRAATSPPSVQTPAAASPSAHTPAAASPSVQTAAAASPPVQTAGVAAPPAAAQLAVAPPRPAVTQVTPAQVRPGSAPPPSPEAITKAEFFAINAVMAAARIRRDGGVTPQSQAFFPRVRLPTDPAVIDALVRGTSAPLRVLDGIGRKMPEAAD